MSEFTDLVHKYEADVKLAFTGARNDLITETDALATKLKADLTPIGYAILQTSVAAAEVSGGAWNVKLLTAVTTASAAFAQKGLPVIINDLVAGITAIIASLNAEKTKISA